MDSFQVEEIRIKVPWGYLAGKWWGPKNVRPILTLHGWQDNAGTFDRLIPLLPKEISYLALDLPGHGLSSRIGDGIAYSTFDLLITMNLVKNAFKWEKLSILAHSMSAILGFVYSSTFPDWVDLYIGLDALKPHVRSDKGIVTSMANRIQNFAVVDTRNRENSEPPGYTFNELKEKLHIGTFQSVDTESAVYLLNRSVAKSSTDSSKYYFTRDARLKCFNYTIVAQSTCIEMAKRIKCPHLFIKALQSPYYEDKDYHDEVKKVLYQSNPLFQSHEVDGTHHVHLNEPEKVANLISEYIIKYRLSDKAKL